MMQIKTTPNRLLKVLILVTLNSEVLSRPQLNKSNLQDSTESSNNNSNSSQDESDSNSSQNSESNSRGAEHSSNSRPNSSGTLLWRRSISTGHTEEHIENKQTDRYFENLYDPLNHLIEERYKKDLETAAKETNVVPELPKYKTAFDISKYGCWCSRIQYLRERGDDFSLEMPLLSGGQHLDAIDEACHSWSKCVRCTQIQTKADYAKEVAENGKLSQNHKNVVASKCNFHEEHLPFTLGLMSDGNTNCLDPSNMVRPCAINSCQCSQKLIEDIAKHIHVFDEKLMTDEGKGKCGKSGDRDLSAILSNSAMNEYYFNSDEDTGFYDGREDTSGLNFGSLQFDNIGEDFARSFSSDQTNSHTNEMKKKRTPSQCCGIAPNWVPYDTDKKFCCKKTSRKNGDIFTQYSPVKIADLDQHTCESDGS